MITLQNLKKKADLAQKRADRAYQEYLRLTREANIAHEAFVVAINRRDRIAQQAREVA